MTKPDPIPPAVEDIKKEPVANIVQEIKPKLEAFSGQFPPIIPPGATESRTSVPVGIATQTNPPVSTPSDLKARFLLLIIHDYVLMIIIWFLNNWCQCEVWSLCKTSNLVLVLGLD